MKALIFLPSWAIYASSLFVGKFDMLISFHLPNPPQYDNTVAFPNPTQS